MAWGFLAKLLGKIGTKVAEKGAEQVAKKTAISVAQKIAGAAKTASGINPQNKTAFSKILNVLTGDLGKNLKSTGSTVGRAGELPKGAWLNKIKGLIVGDLDQVAKKARVPAELETMASSLSDIETPKPALGKIGKLNDVISAIKPTYERGQSAPGPVARGAFQQTIGKSGKGQKLADTVNNVLFGEGFGSNVLRRTMLNAAQQGIFSGSDVGQPEKDKWGILGNSVLGAVAESSFDVMQQQYDNKQTLAKMMNDFNPADEAFKNFQPAVLKEIDGFRDFIVDKGMKPGLRKGKYNSQDMLEIADRYNRLQGKVGRYMQADKQYRQDYSEFQKNYSKYDPVDFKLGSDYFLKTGDYPQGGLLTPAEVDPSTFFSNLSITNKDSWKPTKENMPYEMTSPLTSEQKRALAGTYFYTNPGLQKHILRNELPKWKQQYAGDQELAKMFTNPQTGQFDDMKFAEFMTAQQYGDQIEQNKVDWEKKARYMEKQKEDAEKSAQEAADKTAYSIVSDYPYENNQSGSAVVFKKATAGNVPSSVLRDANGNTIETGADVVPANYEYVDNTGRLVVTASVQEGSSQVRKRAYIPPNNAKGLLEQKFPGITSDPKVASVYAPKNEQPVGVTKSNEVSGVDPKTGRLAVFDANTKQFIRWAK